ncbi:hypothetical protein Cyrtocomes_00491 [Candidatus Cyrtobacter comes]|uniref:Outer membrane protein beta-barrel domain-containing protein n=1 Tax=Candidatus Cyrtobacter comes TaxID=675776 RepID=A0ABU5L7L6_9RICK|nr:hypothetical protein [Candidatus Cyrtobacter comes]MDZ5762122.1 hypothetical protein [Candidatus Cyrtobacter comes]
MSKKIISVGVAALLCSGASAFAMTNTNDEDKMGLLVTGSLGVGSTYKFGAYLDGMTQNATSKDKLSKIEVPFEDSVSKFPYGVAGGIEATYLMMPNMGIGLNFGYMHEMAAKPANTYVGGAKEGTSEVKFSMATIGLNARFCTHLTDSFSVAFKVGPTLNWTRILNAADMSYQWAADSALAKEDPKQSVTRNATLPANASRSFESALGMRAGADFMFHLDSGFMVGLCYEYNLAEFKAALNAAADKINDTEIGKGDVSGGGNYKLTGAHYVGITAGMAF